jgi:hypothetical protein
VSNIGAPLAPTAAASDEVSGRNLRGRRRDLAGVSGVEHSLRALGRGRGFQDLRERARHMAYIEFCNDCDVSTQRFKTTRHSYTVLLAAVGMLVLVDVVFWITVDETNNKPMLFRQSFGVVAGFIATGLAVIAALSADRANRSQWIIMDWGRWTAKIAAGAVVLELALFALRTIFRRSDGYYAMDCSMFAVAAVSIAVAIAALSRCFPLNRPEVD